MLKQLHEWSESGEWELVKLHAPLLFSSLAGDDLSRAQLYYAGAIFQTSRNRSDILLAKEYIEAAESISLKGGTIHTWALQRMVSLYVTLRKYNSAIMSADRFAAEVASHPDLKGLIPYVVRDVAKVYYNKGEYAVAAKLRERALALFCAEDDQYQADRTRIGLVWAYVKLNDFASAIRHINLCGLPIDDAMLAGARAAVCYALHNWSGVIEYGRKSISHRRSGYDLCDEADTLLLMVRAAVELGNYAMAFDFLRKAYSTGELAPAALIRYGGGEYPSETQACGSCGWHPDAAFCTGLG